MKLLVTGAWHDASEHIPTIEAMGHEVAYLQQEKDPLPVDYAWAEGVVCNALFMHHPMECFPNLRFIQLTSAGLDRVDVAEAERRGIEIHNARGVYSAPMAEFAVAGVLAHYKRLYDFKDQQRRHEWRKLRDLRELAGRRVLIVGCGSVGQACATRFAAFGCSVVGVDLRPRVLPGFGEVLGLEALDSELALDDVVVVCVPLTPETRSLVRASRTRPDAVIVNISRGPVLALDAPRAAVLDVFDEEPLLESDPLWDVPGVLATPHVSFVGDGNTARLSKLILNNLKGVAE